MDALRRGAGEDVARERAHWSGELLAARDRDGNSALHHAAFCRLPRTYAALASAGGRAYEPSGEPGWTPASARDGVLTRAAARVHRNLSMRGALAGYRAAMLAACDAVAVAAGRCVQGGRRASCGGRGARGAARALPPHAG